MARLASNSPCVAVGIGVPFGVVCISCSFSDMDRGQRVTDEALFRSAWLKCAWALAQSNEFEREVKAALVETQTDPPFTTRQEYHPEFHGFSVKIATIRPVPIRWGLMLGDMANNFHSALDHVAWALVCRGKTPPHTLKPGRRKGIYFPICSSRQVFNTSLARYLPGVHRRDVARVRKAQPYIHGKRAVTRHCLATLQELSNTDKHQTIQPVWLRPDYSGYQVTEARDCIIRRIRSMHPSELKVDTEIARVYAKKTGPDPDIALHGYVAASVALNNGCWIDNLLKTIRQFLPQVLAQFSQPSVDIETLLAPGKFSL